MLDTAFWPSSLLSSAKHRHLKGIHPTGTRHPELLPGAVASPPVRPEMLTGAQVPKSNTTI